MVSADLRKTDQNTPARVNAELASRTGGKAPFFLRILHIPGKSFDDCMSSGRGAMQDGNYLVAAHHFKAAAKKDPFSAEAQFHLGEALSQQCYLLADNVLPISRHLLTEAIAAFESACCNESPVGNSQVLYDAHYKKAKLIYDFKIRDKLNEAFMSIDSIVCALDHPERGIVQSEIDLLINSIRLRDRIQSAIKNGFEPEIETQPLNREVSLLEKKI